MPLSEYFRMFVEFQSSKYITAYFITFKNIYIPIIKCIIMYQFRYIQRVRNNWKEEKELLLLNTKYLHYTKNILSDHN